MDDTSTDSYEHITRQVGDIVVRIIVKSPVTLEALRTMKETLERLAKEIKLREWEARRKERETDDPTINPSLTSQDYAEFRRQNELLYKMRLQNSKGRQRVIAKMLSRKTRNLGERGLHKRR